MITPTRRRTAGQLIMIARTAAQRLTITLVPAAVAELTRRIILVRRTQPVPPAPARSAMPARPAATNAMVPVQKVKGSTGATVREIATDSGNG